MVGLYVCLSVGHVREPCKNVWTDRDAVWDGPEKAFIRRESRADESIRRREGWQDGDAAFRQNPLSTC